MAGTIAPLQEGKRPPMKTWYPPSWRDCAICRVPTQDALCGNRLLSRWEVARLPTEQAPTLSWRCEYHQHYTLSPASSVHPNLQGDLLFTLVCGHEVLWVFRGLQVFTPIRVTHGLATGQIRLDQPQRCYLCGDREGSEARP